MLVARDSELLPTPLRSDGGTCGSPPGRPSDLGSTPGQAGVAPKPARRVHPRSSPAEAEGQWMRMLQATSLRDPSTFSEGDWRHSYIGTWIPRDQATRTQ